MGWLSVVPVIGSLLDKLIPDKDAREKVEARLKEISLSGELERDIAQIRANMMEGSHHSIFVAGWRPWIGWICGTSILLGAIVKIFLPALIVVISAFTDGDTSRLQALLDGLKTVDVSFFYPIVLGMLGLGGMRSYEKRHGVNHKHE